MIHAYIGVYVLIDDAQIESGSDVYRWCPGCDDQAASHGCVKAAIFEPSGNLQNGPQVEIRFLLEPDRFLHRPWMAPTSHQLLRRFSFGFILPESAIAYVMQAWGFENKTS